MEIITPSHPKIIPLCLPVFMLCQNPTNIKMKKVESVLGFQAEEL